MYIHLGQETLVYENEVVGIFDLDNTTISKHTRKFLNKAQRDGDIINISDELPKSFILCTDKSTKKRKIYLSQISSATLLKRSGEI